MPPSIISNPSAAWTLISTIQLVSFLPLSKNPLPATMNQYCTAIGSYNMIPNIFESWIDKNTSTAPFHEATKIGIKSSIFILNAGSDLTILIIFLSFLPFIVMFSSTELGKITLKFKEKLHEYRYDIFIRFWMQTYLNFGIFAIINYESVRINKDPLIGGTTHKLSKIFSIVYLVIFT